MQRLTDVYTQHELGTILQWENARYGITATEDCLDAPEYLCAGATASVGTHIIQVFASRE